MKVCMIMVAVVASCVAQAPPGWYPSGRALLLPTRIQKEPTTPAPQPNNNQSDEKESERIIDSGEYYLLLEDGKLQMVKYVTAALKEQDETQPQQSQKNQQYKQQAQQYQQASKTQYPVYQQVQNYQQAQPSQQNQQYKQQAQQYQQASKTQYPVYQQAQNYRQAQQSEQNLQYRSSSSADSSKSQQQGNPDQFTQFQLEYVQLPLPGSQYTQTKSQYTAPETNAKPDAEEKEADTKETTGYEAKLLYRDVQPISAPIYAYNPTPLVRILKK